ncbi:MAG: GPGG-motif small membrane protein [Actinomycetota bacterium]|nr:GPGG-motif small membrane protein [Actinomycetota bacterium]
MVDKVSTNMNAMTLWVIAAILAVIGIIVLISGSVLWGIILLVAAAVVGPGGYSIFQRRS